MGIQEEFNLPNSFVLKGEDADLAIINGVPHAVFFWSGSELIGDNQPIDRIMDFADVIMNGDCQRDPTLYLPVPLENLLDFYIDCCRYRNLPKGEDRLCFQIKYKQEIDLAVNSLKALVARLEAVHYIPD